jgi:hypothetical protein
MRPNKSLSPQAELIALTLFSTFQAEAHAAGEDPILIKGCSFESLLDSVLQLGEPDRAGPVRTEGLKGNHVQKNLSSPGWIGIGRARVGTRHADRSTGSG